MEKNKLSFNMPEQPNEGKNYVTIMGCGMDHSWKDDPFGEKELAEQAPVVPERQQPLEGESVDDNKKD